MTRTLADMTPAEQQACVGMWADFQPASTPRPVVILHAEEAWGRAAVFDPTAQVIEPIAAPSGWVTPRFDLPRAWTPEGEPVPGEWEESTSTPGIRRWCARWEMKPDEQATEKTPDSPQPGEAWLIEYEGQRYEAVYWYSPIYAHWAFVENREGLRTVESPEAIPLSRLVPERGDVS